MGRACEKAGGLFVGLVSVLRGADWNTERRPRETLGAGATMERADAGRASWGEGGIGILLNGWWDM